MKKIKTSSQYVTIMDNIGNKFVRKSKKREDLKAYLRAVPQKKMLLFLDSTKIRHPKILKNRFTYIDEEYIDGKSVDLIDKNALISLFCNYEYDMFYIDCTKIKKYSKWTNNTEFLYYNVDLLYSMFKKNKNMLKLESIGLNLNSILAFKNLRLDDQRKLTLIHGDFCCKNLIEKNMEYTLVDWEQGCYGDFAYELAMHFIMEDYSLSEQAIVIDRLSKTLGLNQTNLVRDIKIYTNFEILRRCFIKFDKVINMKKSKEDYESLLREVYNDYFKLQNPKVYEELKTIIESN